MRIHAITTGTPDNIQARLELPEVRAVSRLLAACDVEITRPLTVAELDPKIGHPKPVERIQINTKSLKV
jgi:hypothetical protein